VVFEKLRKTQQNKSSSENVHMEPEEVVTLNKIIIMWGATELAAKPGKMIVRAIGDFIGSLGISGQSNALSFIFCLALLHLRLTLP
jgi:hypothetical protein